MSTRSAPTSGHGPAATGLACQLLVTACLLLAARVSVAGDIVGAVNDPALGRYVDGAAVSIVETGRRAVTDRRGRYTLRNVAAGQYTLEATTGGYQKESVRITVPETGEVEANFTLSSTYLAEITVVGSRVSQLLALQHKREALSILDAVSADTVGKLPDFNAAEAIQRLPGLAVELDQGEGRYPIIRGIDPNLNNVTIDGNLVGAPEGEGRRVALDVVPSDLIAVVEVVKAVTPDLDGNAVGGNINIVTRSAFDQLESFAVVGARAGYNEKSGRVPYGVNAAWGSTLGPDEQWALSLAASYYIRRYESDLTEGIDWAEFAPGSFAPEEVRWFDYDIERERIGFNANLEYRPSDERLWYLRSIFNEFTDHEGRDQLDLDAARGTTTALSSTLVQHSQGRATREYRQNNQTQRLINLSTGGELTFDNVTWNLSYTYSHAEEITPLRTDWEYRSSGSAFPNTIDVSTLFWQLDAGTAIHDPARYPFRRVRFRMDNIEDDIHSLKTDLKIDTHFGDRPGYWKFGLKHDMRDKYRDRTNHNYTGAVSWTLASQGLYFPGPSNFFEGLYVLGPILDYEGHENLFRTSPEMFSLDDESSALDSIATDYDIDEKISAGYGLLSVDIGKWTVLGGVRLEYTDAIYRAYFVDLPPEDPLNPATPVLDKNSYLDVLPSLHVTYRPRDNVVIRGAWTNTIGRPNFESVVPSFEVEDDEGSSGNPELKPFESMGFDLSLEYYLEPTGIASIGLFYKRIKNPIFGRRTTNVVFRGIPLDSLSQPENAKSGTLLGLELNWEQQFVNLPRPWDGIGAAINLTLVDSDVDVFGREGDDLPFFRQADVIGNAALFYTIGGFEARLAANYRDHYLQSIGGDSNEDVYFGKRTQVDFKISYKASDKMSVFAEWQNLNDASRREWQGTAGRLFADEIYSWTALAGVTYTF